MRRGSIALFGIVAAALYWAPALYHFDRTGFGDWQTFVHQWEATRAGLFRHGELALWNPWHCGGTLLWGDPQAQGFGPIFWLTVVPFGSAIGGHLFLWIHTAIGFAGMFVAARRLLGVYRRLGARRSARTYRLAARLIASKPADREPPEGTDHG